MTTAPTPPPTDPPAPPPAPPHEPAAAPPASPPGRIAELRAAAVRGDRGALMQYLRLTRPTAA